MVETPRIAYLTALRGVSPFQPRQVAGLKIG